MGNVEAGAGSNNRYKLRGLAIKFSDKERVGIFANNNNLNDNQRAALNGEWSPQDVGVDYRRLKPSVLNIYAF